MKLTDEQIAVNMLQQGCYEKVIAAYNALEDLFNERILERRP